MDVYTPPPSPPTRHAARDRDRTRGRRTASPRLKIRGRSFSERPPTPVAVPHGRHSPSPELIFSMSPIDSHMPAPKTPLNPGALLARARQQSAAGLRHAPARTRPPPLLYSFPNTTLASADEAQDAAASAPLRFPEPASRAGPIPIAAPLPKQQEHGSYDSAAYSFESFYGCLDEDDEEDDEERENVHSRSRAAPRKMATTRPLKTLCSSRPLRIVGFDTGTDDDDDSHGHANPFRFERYVPHNVGDQEAVKPLRTRNRAS